MRGIVICGGGKYLPTQKIENEYFENKFQLDKDWILKRTGITCRYWKTNETITEMAIKATENLLENMRKQDEINNQFDIQKIGCIIVASCTNSKLMPGVSFEIQKAFNIKKCICMDISCGCSGYINGIDLIKKYITLNEIEYGLVIGAETLSEYLETEDLDTSILLGDGAGATLIGAIDKEKVYKSHIESIGQEGDILTCEAGKKIHMDGKKIYKFGTVTVAKSINELLEKSNTKIEEIKYVIPHQSNIRIINGIANRIGLSHEKMYMNIQKVGNTFNASIPIAISDIIHDCLLEKGDKVILVGYGGGLNLGSILLEI